LQAFDVGADAKGRISSRLWMPRLAHQGKRFSVWACAYTARAFCFDAGVKNSMNFQGGILAGADDQHGQIVEPGAGELTR